mmetsp:Transcript_12897/g.24623  ORF Transcript_12897/g.24623 Transcript_12897/m.24623 type:complete len:285 (-) Transcript_12897:284-1138(-)
MVSCGKKANKRHISLSTQGPTDSEIKQNAPKLPSRLSSLAVSRRMPITGVVTPSNPERWPPCRRCMNEDKKLSNRLLLHLSLKCSHPLGYSSIVKALNLVRIKIGACALNALSVNRPKGEHLKDALRYQLRIHDAHIRRESKKGRRTHFLLCHYEAPFPMGKEKLREETQVELNTFASAMPSPVSVAHSGDSTAGPGSFTLFFMFSLSGKRAALSELDQKLKCFRNAKKNYTFQWFDVKNAISSTTTVKTVATFESSQTAERIVHGWQTNKPAPLRHLHPAHHH